MSDQVINLISEVKAKALKFHSALVSERAKSADLEKSLAESKANSDAVSAENIALKKEIENLKDQLNRPVEPTIIEKSVTLKDEEIDELVKEIEFCIEQLKK